MTPAAALTQFIHVGTFMRGDTAKSARAIAYLPQRPRTPAISARNRRSDAVTRDCGPCDHRESLRRRTSRTRSPAGLRSSPAPVWRHPLQRLARDVDARRGERGDDLVFQRPGRDTDIVLGRELAELVNRVIVTQRQTVDLLHRGVRHEGDTCASDEKKPHDAAVAAADDRASWKATIRTTSSGSS